jgi:hypothetical protein
MVDKVRAFIVARPIITTIVMLLGGVAVEWLTKFLESLQGAPAI